jgi:hypothetical protein
VWAAVVLAFAEALAAIELDSNRKALARGDRKPPVGSVGAWGAVLIAVGFAVYLIVTAFDG